MDRWNGFKFFNCQASRHSTLQKWPWIVLTKFSVLLHSLHRFFPNIKFASIRSNILKEFFYVVYRKTEGFSFKQQLFPFFIFVLFCHGLYRNRFHLSYSFSCVNHVVFKYFVNNFDHEIKKIFIIKFNFVLNEVTGIFRLYVCYLAFKGR